MTTSTSRRRFSTRSSVPPTTPSSPRSCRSWVLGWPTPAVPTWPTAATSTLCSGRNRHEKRGLPSEHSTLSCRRAVQGDRAREVLWRRAGMTVATDPGVDFWLQYVAAEGGLHEQTGGATLVLLPETLQERHRQDAEMTVTGDPDIAREDRAMLMTVGHPLLTTA